MSTIFLRSNLNYIKNTIKDSQQVYVIEPVPVLFKKISESSLSDLPSCKFFDNTIDIEEGQADFYISDKTPELSSLYNFSREVYRAVPKRKDWYFNRKCIVEKVRLDTFISEQGIENVDHLHVHGCQGNNLNVLKSLGDKIDIVQTGICKGDWLASIYDSENHALTIVSFLLEKGFAVKIHSNKTKVMTTGPNGSQKGLEATIHFERKIV